ncbi:unnamed protein product [Adineta steineri]|uniref:non-specific serine/threonine protein kinase n=1 Tax=Adineta steineri TaxID=433720 RepID=A0A814AB05_9BILA|nr:unnamed protein product [Adineta steineri]CAF4032870.1 unnamed protein product [Adineta steineri]
MSIQSTSGALNDFDICKSVVNRGHFATVYFARNRITGINVALKQVELSRMTDNKAIDDCKREVFLLQQLDHPNIIKYISHFIDNNDLYIVLELARAGDLSKMFRSFRKRNILLKEKIIWKFFCQITCGLEYMHSKRIMHRDIKPANIFINEHGSIKLGDLGLSRYFDSKTILVYSNVGTPYYMAPERIDGQNQGYNFQSDIWSLACILYEMVVLRSPFYEINLDFPSLQRKILTLKYEPLSTQLYSTNLHFIINKCLILKSEERLHIDVINNIAKTMNTYFLTQTTNNVPIPIPSSSNSSTFDDHTSDQN